MELRNLSKAQNNKSTESENTIDSISNTIKELISNKKQPKNMHEGHRARLKNQFLVNGLDALTDIQKLELLLYFSIPQKDTNPIAHNLLNYFGSLKNVIHANYTQLMKVSGIKENSALLINLVNSYVNYYHMPNNNKDSISSSNSAIEIASKLFHGVSNEQFYVICLTKSNTIKKISLIAEGSGDEIKDIQIRTITQLAIENNVNRIIIAHNHPNGVARMSDSDCKFTFSVVCSCILNSIEVLDHIIVGENNDTLSLHDGKIMERIKRKAIEKLNVPEETQLFLSAISKEYKRSKIVEIEIPDWLD